MAGDRHTGRSRLGIDPALRSILSKVELIDATTDLDLEDNVILGADNRKIAFGNAGTTDSYIDFDGANLRFYDSTVGVTKTLTQLSAAQGTLDNAFDQGKLIDGSAATGAANAFSVGGAAADDKVEIFHNATTGTINCRAGDLNITAAGGDISLGDDNLTTTGTINIGADNVNLTLGAAGATDAYLKFDGSDLLLFDSTLGTTVTLSTLAGSNLTNPTVTGDLTISDGQLIWTDSSDEQGGTFTFSNVANDGIRIICNAMTSGSALRIESTEGTLSGGFYLEAYDNTAGAAVATIGEDGAIVITGAAASDMVTITAGDLQIDNGKFEVDTTQDIVSYVKRNNAASAAAVVELEQTHTGSTGPCLLLDQNATGAATTLEISTAGDGNVIDIAASAARTGDVINIQMGNQLAQTALDINGAATGTNGEGIIHVDVTGVLAGNAIRVDSTGANAATGQLIYALSTGKQAGATEGICAYFSDTGAATATSYTVSISSTNNEALHVDAGQSLFDERVNITLADNTGPALAITNPDTTGNSNAVTVTPSGSGAGILVSPQEADTIGLQIASPASSTVAMIDLDLSTNDWIGGATTGAINVTGDGAIVADGTLLRLASSGQPAAANDGVCLEIVETGAAQATSYAMRITSSNNEALHVDAGAVLIDEICTVSGGVITKFATTDTANPPTQAELVTAFGAANQGAGLIGILDDAGGGANEYICWSDGTNWWYIAGTIGA